MSVPSVPFSLMAKAYLKIFPAVHEELFCWKKRAERIPDPELRRQALASINHKTFHCEGGAILALAANERYREVIRFIVAYQTISDYLDNLCDRSTSLDPEDFSALHEAMMDALTLDEKQQKAGDYYRFRTEQEDGNYLYDLAATCREVLSCCRHYEEIKKYLWELCQYYCDLQVHKHVVTEQRVPRLRNWFNAHKESIPKMSWFEFSACSGSTLGIFCLVAYAFRDDFKNEYAEHIRQGYFPYIQGLHIMLDYFIDQEEDREEGDLNFCFYYRDEAELFQRLHHFVKEADRHTEELPHKRFHQLINRGLLGLYLSDEKVRKQQNIRRLAKKILRKGGAASIFFYINALLYRKWQKHSTA